GRGGIPVSKRSGGRSDVLVHREEILRIVGALDLGEPGVVGAVDDAHAIFLVRGHEVDVGAAGGVGGGRVEEVAGPAVAAGVVLRIVPAPVHVHDEPRVPGRIGGGVGGGAQRRAAE